MHDRRPLAELPLVFPPTPPDAVYADAAEAVADLRERYAAATGFLREPVRRASWPATSRKGATAPSIRWSA